MKSYLQCHLKRCKVLATPGTHFMPGGHEHDLAVSVIFRLRVAPRASTYPSSSSSSSPVGPPRRSMSASTSPPLRPHSPRRSHRGQKYGPKSAQTNLTGQVARLTSQDATISRASGDSPVGSRRSPTELSLFTSCRRARTAGRSSGGDSFGENAKVVID